MLSDFEASWLMNRGTVVGLALVPHLQQGMNLCFRLSDYSLDVIMEKKFPSNKGKDANKRWKSFFFLYFLIVYSQSLYGDVFNIHVMQ